jgi:hypothetical protein
MTPSHPSKVRYAVANPTVYPALQVTITYKICFIHAAHQPLSQPGSVYHWRMPNHPLFLSLYSFSVYPVLLKQSSVSETCPFLASDYCTFLSVTPSLFLS